MATPDLSEEHRVLKQQNLELVQKVQYWKMLAGQRENEKIDLLKELNEMRLQLARIRNNGNVLASKFDAALESACKKALSNVVKASGEIASAMDLAKSYMRDRVEDMSPRWSSISGTPRGEKVHRVPPMNIGGQSIHPVVSLSRTLLSTSNARPVPRSLNQNRNVTERAVPMHMLQDVYIPLTRIDAGELQANNEQVETEGNNSEDSADELELEASGERTEITDESQHMSDVNDDDEHNSRLGPVIEDLEPEDDEATLPRDNSIDNPLEGPSWLLDAPSSSNKSLAQPRNKLEPDSTTEVEEMPLASGNVVRNNPIEVVACASRMSYAFSPTVRRRKRTSTPPPEPYSPRQEHTHRNNNSGRVLKVMVAKMRLDSLSPGTPAAKRALAELYDAPSPNGATVSGVIVSEATLDALDFGASGEPHRKRRDSRRPSQPSHDRDSGQASLDSRHSSLDSRESSHGSRQTSNDSTQSSHDARQSNHDSSQPCHDSIQTGHSSKQTGHESKQTGHESKQTGHKSKQTGHESKQTGHESKQTGHKSKQTGHGSRQKGHESRRPVHEDHESSTDESEIVVKKERDSRCRSRRDDSRADVRSGSHNSRDSDSGELGEGRSRRARNRLVNYQEKPLNRKMRR